MDHSWVKSTTGLLYPLLTYIHTYIGSIYFFF
jgi:hypothetical protein